MNDKNSIRNYCFTPIVSLSTFAIEFLFAFYVFVKYRKTFFGKIAIAILILLGVFQLAEYNICKSGYIIPWTTIGYLAITFLVPLGIHMNSLITKKWILTPVSYISATLISLVILFVPGFLTNPTCSGNFIIFNPLLSNSKIIYGVYYFGFIALGLLPLIKAVSEKQRNKTLATWMLAGYASFIIPTAIVFIYEKTTRMAVPSIMCGFAVLFAIILVAKILPEFEKLELEKNK